jgi:hypothetical protein
VYENELAVSFLPYSSHTQLFGSSEEGENFNTIIGVLSEHKNEENRRRYINLLHIVNKKNNNSSFPHFFASIAITYQYLIFHMSTQSSFNHIDHKSSRVNLLLIQVVATFFIYFILQF